LVEDLTVDQGLERSNTDPNHDDYGGKGDHSPNSPRTAHNSTKSSIDRSSKNQETMLVIHKHSAAASLSRDLVSSLLQPYQTISPTTNDLYTSEDKASY